MSYFSSAPSTIIWSHSYVERQSSIRAFKMLCEFFTFLTCFEIVYREEETCAEQCAIANRVVPSFDTVQHLSPLIMNQSESLGKHIAFPIDVEFDFEQDQWFDVA